MKRRLTILALTALAVVVLISVVLRLPPRRSLGERRKYRGSAFLPERVNVPSFRQVLGSFTNLPSI